MAEDTRRVERLDKLISMLTECERFAGSLDDQDAKAAARAVTKAKDKISARRGRVIAKIKTKAE